MNRPPALVISLDFELHWGRFDKWPLESSTSEGRFFQKYFLNTREVIPQMLEVMKQQQIHATWATVGFLFHDSKVELQSNIPSLLPAFKDQKFSAYYYIDTKGIGTNESDDPFHFAPSLIRQIAQTSGMEIGSQTFAHYYACAQGQTAGQFSSDLQSARTVAQARGLELKSIVMPKNEINPEYLSICMNHGIEVVRINPDVWYWDIPVNKPVTFLDKLARTADAYIPIGKRKSFSLKTIQRSSAGPILIPASRFLRPYTSRFPILNKIRMRRILKEMEVSARKNELYHLWWHPHNFGAHPEESMIGLKQILDHYQKLNKEYGMISLNMAEVADMVKKQRSSR